MKLDAIDPRAVAEEIKALPSDGTALRYHMLELAESMSHVIALGRGDPDLDTPPHVVEAALAALKEGRVGPAPLMGLPELRRAVAAKLARDNDVHVDPDREVLITAGGQEALFLAVLALLDEGDEILVPDPRYTSYDQAIAEAGARMVLVPTRPENDFELDPDEVERRITPRTRALLIITPNNPTAGIVHPPTIRRLAELARAYDLIVLSDEIYEKFVYDGAETLSIASLPGMAERTVTLNALSKTYAMTGWRVGYAAGRAPLIAAMARLKAAGSGTTSTLSQWAAVAALEGPQDCVAEMQATYSARRRLVLEALDRMGMTYSRPWGGLYVWANAASSGLTANQLCFLFLKYGGVLIFPGTGFGERWSDWVRITLLQPADVLREAMTRMEAVLEAVRRGQ